MTDRKTEYPPTGRLGSKSPEMPGYVSDIESYVERLRNADNVVEEKPSFVANVSGREQLSFIFSDHDGGIAVLGGSKYGSALDHPDLQAATPAMIYHAVTTGADGFPEDLLTHHAGIARQFDIPSFQDAVRGHDRGWLLAGPPSQLASSPCDNATFSQNICAHPYYDEWLCKMDTTGSWAWNVPGAYRYKAGFCLQRGEAQSWLEYEHVRWNAPLGGCESCRVIHTAWGADSLFSGKKWSAPTYLVYVWWKSASSSWGRSFTHVGGFGTGDLFDWGQRYSWKRCRDFT